MARIRANVASIVALAWLCAPVYGFQAPGAANAKVLIEPRIRIGSGDAGRQDFDEDPRSRLRVDASMVLVPVSVSTALGTPVTGLARENFRIAEDNTEQRITYFAKDDAPLSVGVLFDASGSMHNKIRQSAEAVAEFFKTANAGDEFFLVEFNERPKLAVPFTPDSDELYRRIAHTKPLGRTSLLDAIHMALGEMKNARNPRKAMVIVSDGGDNRSRFTPGQIKSAMLESDVQLFAMGIYDPEDARKRTIEEQNGPELLDQLASDSGGRHYRVDNLAELPAISARISDELRNQYLLGYTPGSSNRDGKFHRIKVGLTPNPDQPELLLRFRTGYYAPAQ